VVTDDGDNRWQIRKDEVKGTVVVVIGRAMQRVHQPLTGVGWGRKEAHGVGVRKKTTGCDLAKSQKVVI
jgi:hypothetical protein